MSESVKRFQDRFENTKFVSPEIKAQLAPVVEYLDTYNQRGRGVEFNAILINLATVYPEDQEKVIALFADIPETITKPAKLKSPENDVYAKKVKREGEKCETCGDDLSKITYGQYMKMTPVERAALGLSELPFIQSKSDNLEPSAIQDITKAKTPADVIEFFGGNGKREYVEVMASMKSFAEGLGIDLGNKRKAESIAETILESIKE